LEHSFHDEVLGALTWNEDLEWWEGQTQLTPGHPIQFSISQEEVDAAAQPTAEVQQARRVIAFLREHEEEARVVAADEVLELYNLEWNEGDPLSEEEFMSRLTLDDISIAFDGSAELFYKDDGLFAGHTLLVTISAEGTFEDADIAG
jgi:hypothetical protein